MSEQETTTIRLGEGETYPAEVAVTGGGVCRIQIQRTDLPDVRNFPAILLLTKLDALKLVAQICERLARYKHDEVGAGLGIAAAICERLAREWMVKSSRIRQELSMRRKPSGRYWRITLMYRGKEDHIADIPITHITNEQLRTLMRMLFAKRTLTDQEIVRSHLRKSIKRHSNLLNIVDYFSEDLTKYTLSDGSNWVDSVVVRPEDQHRYQNDVSTCSDP